MTGKLGELEASLKALASYRKFNKLAFYKPYPKQLEFHNMGSWADERLLRAGNRNGKTLCGAAEMAMHLTGIYPKWWQGKRFSRPVRCWAAGESSVVVRDVQQKLLCGAPGVSSDFGTGYIPKDRFRDRPSLSRGVTDAFDTIQVMHTTEGVEDGISTLGFKSYEQGRTKFQGDEIDVVWPDEEPSDYGIYSEMRTRTLSAHGIMFTTFTPLFGKTALLSRFMDEKDPKRGEVVMTIYDALHFKPEEIQAIINQWQPYERDARALGQPMMGEGRVFPFGDETIVEDPLSFIPPEWTRLWGIDFGTGGTSHPFAAVLILYDREADTVHVHFAKKTTEPLIVQHVAMMKPVGESVRVAWPHDGNSRERGAQDQTMTTAKLYRAAGLNMLPEHATFQDGGISTEAGITEMYERMKTGRLKVSRTALMGDWGNEFRGYHREDGQLVKVSDDLMSATRIAVMAKRKGDTTVLGPLHYRARRPEEQQTFASNVDFDLFA